MNHFDAISDFFKSPRWLPNLLMGAVCMLIPVLGPVVLTGWHTGCLFSKRDTIDFTTYPPFDFNHFGLHLGRGIWSFVIQLIVSLVILPLLWVLGLISMGMFIALTAGTQSGAPPSDLESAILIGTIFISGILAASIGVLLSFVLRALTLRAGITQDFGQAFDFNFVLDFTKRTWAAQLVCLLFLILISIPMMIAGMLVFCVGTYAALSLLIFVQCHLNRQLYDLYLTRGGTPVTVSPKLMDTPPPLPPAGLSLT